MEVTYRIGRRWSSMLNRVGVARDVEIGCRVRAKVLPCAVCGGSDRCLRIENWKEVGTNSTQALSSTLGRHAPNLAFGEQPPPFREAFTDNFQTLLTMQSFW